MLVNNYKLIQFCEKYLTRQGGIFTLGIELADLMVRGAVLFPFPSLEDYAIMQWYNIIYLPANN